MTLVLASSSPRRRDLLGRLSVPFDVIPSTVIERPPRNGEQAPEYALALACEKARDVARRVTQRPVLAADTVVAIGDLILGKPTDADDAARMLRLLRGGSHIAATGIAFIDGDLRAAVEVATVTMRQYSDAEIDAYVATGEPMDKAGAYAVQGLGGSLVARVTGCRNAVVGLPLCRVVGLLFDVDFDLPPLPADFCPHVE